MSAPPGNEEAARQGGSLRTSNCAEKVASTRRFIKSEILRHLVPRSDFEQRRKRTQADAKRKSCAPRADSLGGQRLFGEDEDS